MPTLLSFCRRQPAVFIACFLLVSGSASAVWANPIDPVGPSFDELRGNVRAELDRRGIPETDIRLIDLKPRLGSTIGTGGRGSADQVVGYDAWVRLKSCEKGYVVVRLSRYGFVRHAFSHGACDPPGF